MEQQNLPIDFNKDEMKSLINMFDDTRFCVDQTAFYIDYRYIVEVLITDVKLAYIPEKSEFKLRYICTNCEDKQTQYYVSPQDLFTNPKQAVKVLIDLFEQDLMEATKKKQLAMSELNQQDAIISKIITNLWYLTKNL